MRVFHFHSWFCACSVDILIVVPWFPWHSLGRPKLSLKVGLLQVLKAENRNIIFVEETGGPNSALRLLRVVSVSDIWRLLMGDARG